MLQKDNRLPLPAALAAGIAIAVSLCIYPLGLFKIKVQNASLEKGMAVSGPITESAAFAGIFRPARSGLASVGLRFYAPGSGDNDGTLRFLLKDMQDQVIYESTVPIHTMKNNQYYEFGGFGVKLNPGEPYVYQLNAYDYGDTPPCVYLGSPDIASVEHQAVYYDGQEQPGNAAVMVYGYRTKGTFTEALPYFIILFTIALLCAAALSGSAARIPGGTTDKVDGGTPGAATGGRPTPDAGKSKRRTKIQSQEEVTL